MRCRGNRRSLVYSFDLNIYSDRVLFALTLNASVAEYFDVGVDEFKFISDEYEYTSTLIDVNLTSTAILERISSELNDEKASLARFLPRQADEEGGKSAFLHTALNESRALLILSTIPCKLKDANSAWHNGISHFRRSPSNERWHRTTETCNRKRLQRNYGIKNTF